MNNNPLKSNLGRIQAKQIDAEQIKRQGWNKERIFVVKLDDDRLNWAEKELIKQIGDRIYNNKHNKNGGINHGK